MSFSAWLSELNRVLIVFIPCTIVGMVSGYLAMFFIIGLIAYGLWTAGQMITLKRWFDSGAHIGDAPEFKGIADQLVSGIADLQRQNSTRQNSLEELVNQFNEMTAALPDAVIVLKPSGEIQSSNQAADDLLHINPDGDAYSRITQLFRDPSFTEYFLAGKFDEPLEVQATATGEKELSIRIISFSEDRLVLIAQDMSQAARIYEMRRSFISNASHELRTPLTVILGYLETLSGHPKFPEECKTAIHSAELQALRMKQLVEDLLVLSRIESTAPVAKESETIPVAPIIMEVVKEAVLSPGFNEHDIQTLIETDASLKGDLQEIHSVISNLVNNAIKHTEPGTSIRVSWKMAGQEFAELTVTDTGQGIAPEHIDRLTERFYRVDAGRSREKGGTGLGLSIVKHVVERHEGHLVISSELGQGARFTCSFPTRRLLLEDL